MKDSISIIDYKRYLLEYSIPEWEALSKITRERYEKAKLRYESNWLVNLFGWKYENSLSCESANWNFHEEVIEERKAELKRCEYHDKQGSVYIQSNLNIYDAFYNWCKDNNTPY